MKGKDSIQMDVSKDLYMSTIENLPLANAPDVFGLHPNAEIGYYTNSAKGSSH